MTYASLWDRLCAWVDIEVDCWTWTGAVRRHGGGHRPALTVWVPGGHPKRVNAARVMCELIHGPAPTPTHEASHLCDDNWLCICPDHLIWETASENRIRQWEKKKREALEIDLFTKGEITDQCPF